MVVYVGGGMSAVDRTGGIMTLTCQRYKGGCVVFSLIAYSRVYNTMSGDGRSFDLFLFRRGEKFSAGKKEDTSDQQRHACNEPSSFSVQRTGDTLPYLFGGVHFVLLCLFP